MLMEFVKLGFGRRKPSSVTFSRDGSTRLRTHSRINPASASPGFDTSNVNCVKTLARHQRRRPVGVAGRRRLIQQMPGSLPGLS